MSQSPNNNSIYNNKKNTLDNINFCNNKNNNIN